VEGEKQKINFYVHHDVRFEFFKAVKIKVEVFWVMMPSSVVVGYQHSSC
jgi:hypothetical protein